MNPSDVSAMRDLGRSLSDQGFFEVDLVSGHITWANEKALDRCGYTFDQIRTFTVFDLVPEQFHEGLRNSVSDQTSGKFHKFSMWPMQTASGDLVWWYSVRVKTVHPLYWYRCEYLNTTGKEGSDFSSMCAAMHTTNGYNDLYNRLADFQTWTRENVERINTDVTGLQHAVEDLHDDIAKLQGRVDLATKAAERAADIGLENQQTLATMKREMSEEFSKQTAEIIRLISTDAIHSKRLEVFESHMQQSAARAVQIIRVQADKSGKDMARKVTIPVGAIAAILTLVQWLIQHFSK